VRRSEPFDGEDRSATLPLGGKVDRRALWSGPIQRCSL